MDKELLEKLAREKRAEYMREYRKRPGYAEKQKEYQKRYWEKKALEDLKEKEA